jgi:hypothetical protein
MDKNKCSIGINLAWILSMFISSCSIDASHISSSTVTSSHDKFRKKGILKVKSLQASIYRKVL